MESRRKRGKVEFKAINGKAKRLDEVAQEYYNVCKVKGIEEITIKGYKSSMKYFNAFNGDQEMDKDSVNRFVLNLMERGFKDTTINSYIQKLSPILKYAYSKNYLPKVEVNLIKAQRAKREIYSSDELDLLLDYPKQKSFVSIRNWAIVWTFASTGIRRNELLELRVSSLDLLNRVINLPSTKNKKFRAVPISSSLYMVLMEYMEYRGGDVPDEFLFCSVFKTRMQTSTINKELETYNRARGVGQTGIHKYRHTFITNAINNNINLILLQKITGHSTLHELNNYYQENPKDVSEIIDMIAPKEKKKKMIIK